MRNLATLIYYELKKQYSKKVFPILIIISLIITPSVIYINTGDALAEKQALSVYNGIEWSRENFDKVIDIAESSQEKRCRYVQQLDWYYTFSNLNESLSYDDWLYYRQNMINGNYSDLMLSDNEISYWNKSLENTETSTLGYAGGWVNILSSSSILTAMYNLMIALLLCSAFSDEHIYKTDTVTICTKNGKNSLFIAKIISAIISALLLGIIIITAEIVSSGILGGFDGFNISLQVCSVESVFPVTIGGFLLRIWGLMIISGIMTAVFVLCLSLISRNSVVPLSVMSGIILIPAVFTIHTGSRVIQQILSFLPVLRCGDLTVFDARLTLGLNAVDSSFILYSLFTVVTCFITLFAYKRYQITSR